MIDNLERIEEAIINNRTELIKIQQKIDKVIQDSNKAIKKTKPHKK